MAITDKLTIQEDALLVPGRELVGWVREKLAAGEGDYAVSRLRVRTPSKILDSEAADLIEQFRTPKTVVEAVVGYSRLRQKDPEEVFKEAFPLLLSLYNVRKLVPLDSVSGVVSGQVLPRFTPGDSVLGTRVLKCVHLLEDTEVYQVEDSTGELLALKCAREGAGQTIVDAIKKEVSILQLLDGHPSPRLLATGELKGSEWSEGYEGAGWGVVQEAPLYILTEWFSGESAETAVRSLRETVADEVQGRGQTHDELSEQDDGRPAEMGELRLGKEQGEERNALRAAQVFLELCCRILEAYADLHEKGIVHADVHPGNLIIAEDGRSAEYKAGRTIKIIDFGLARRIPARRQPSASERPWAESEHSVPTTPGEGLEKGLQEPVRGGVSFYFEPEYAKAYLRGLRPPAASEQGEQYALGALLYFLLIGEHYLSFSYKKREMLRQIAEDAPRPFPRWARLAWPGVESILAKALRKEPHERYPSVRDFAQHLREVVTSLTSTGRNRSSPVHTPSAGLALLQSVLLRLGPSGTLIRTGLGAAPTCSVNMGSAGIAYMFYRLASLQDDPRLLYSSELWLERTSRDLGREGAFHSKELDINEAKIGLVTPYHTASGVHCVQALVSHSLWDSSSVRQAVKEFVAASLHPCDNLDLTLGRSGTLIGCALMLEALKHSDKFDLSPLVELGGRMLDEIWSHLNGYAPVGECKEMPWFGMAHGWAGILYATMRWCRVSGSPLPMVLQTRLEQLARWTKPVGRGLSWRLGRGPGVNTHEVRPGWCHGSAGYVLLWTLAYEVYGDASYLTLAAGAAYYTWEHTSRHSASLCCGLAGQAYALLSLYRYTREEVWLQRAKELGERAALGASGPQLRANSLYRGDVGVALLAADLMHPQQSSTPLLEAEGWPIRDSFGSSQN